MGFKQPNPPKDPNEQKGTAGSEGGFTIPVYIEGDIVPTPSTRPQRSKPAKKRKVGP